MMFAMALGCRQSCTVAMSLVARMQEVTTKHQLYYWETNWLILDNDDHLV